MKPENKRTITVEDLIRLKRAERPPAEFWTRFESEIRAKQLSAIIEKPSAWDGLFRVLSGLRRYSIPIGASAAVALSFAGYQFVRTDAVSHPAPVALHAAGSSAKPSAPAVREQAPAMVAAVPAPSPKATARVAPAVLTAATEHVSQAPVASQTEVAARTPFVDNVSVTLADFRQVMPDIAKHGGFGSDRDFEAVVQSARQVASEPLSQVDPSQERRARLLDSALPSSTRTFANDLTKVRSDNDRIYESMDRYESNERSVAGFRF